MNARTKNILFPPLSVIYLVNWSEENSASVDGPIYTVCPF